MGNSSAELCSWGRSKRRTGQKQRQTDGRQTDTIRQGSEVTDAQSTSTQSTTPGQAGNTSEKSGSVWGGLQDAQISSSLASLVRGMLQAARKSMPQEHSCTPSPFCLGLGTTVFPDQLQVYRQDYA